MCMCGLSCHPSRLTYPLLQPNILIDAKGNPRLSDFGLWPIVEQIVDSNNRRRPTHSRSWALPYSAPELVSDLLNVTNLAKVEKGRPTSKSDVYSLSMVIVEARPFSKTAIFPGSDWFCFQLMSKNVPYTGIDEGTVIRRILLSQGPLKPHTFEVPGMTPAVWKIAKRCWHRKVEKRPELDTVLQYLENLANPGM